MDRPTINDDRYELPGDVRIFWAKLTEEDKRYIANDISRLIECLQQRYHWSLEQARREVSFRLNGVYKPAHH